MKKVKALRNFSCNGVRKQKGEFLTEDEKEIIGKEFGADLIKKDIIVVLEEKKNVDSDSNVDNIVDLNELDRSGLIEYAESLDLKIHHNCKEEKIKELINEKLNG